ncbi:MAG: ferrous iron transport protein A [Adlercreutzia sp.]|nr:ferrous iron transport protein A [Adlercreutzia sp.]
MTLAEAEPGMFYTVARLGGERRFLSRITAVGLTEGCRLKVLQNRRKRPVLVHARDSVLALDRDDCARIDVEVAA